MNDDSASSSSKFGSLWRTLRRPSASISLLALLAVGFVSGIVFWGGFNTVMEATNTLGFCTSCHEMRDNVFKEYSTTIHYQNRTGVQATCSDCHVPKDWVHKFIRKIQASNEVFHWALGSVNTPEKFDAKRLTLAGNVWRQMKETDSRECRNCHTIESMNPEFQRPRARKQHLSAMEAGNTCIDCHKGIAHKNVRDRLTDAQLDALEAPIKAYIKEIPKSYFEGLKRAEAREAAAQPQPAPAPAPAVPAPAATSAPAPAAPAPAAASAPASPSASGGSIDWSGVPVKVVPLFYPGQASFEWVQNGRDHGGSRAFLRGGDRCAECHSKETKDMGAKIVSGSKAEATPIPGKRGSLDLAVQTAYDAGRLYFRFQWKDAPHTPVPFAAGGKMDPENKVKLAVMFSGTGIERVEQAGCWVTCHNDSRYMPDAPKPEALKSNTAAQALGAADGITKYLPETRTEIEIKGEDNKPRGGGLKVKDKAAIDGLAAKGAVMDVIRFRSGGAAENGSVLEQRHANDGAPVDAKGELQGDTWTVVMSRPLKSDKPGDISLEAGKTYIVNFALHDDYTVARFHHVSLEFKFGLDAAGAEISAVKK
jgi:cytochrome c-type protein NapC